MKRLALILALAAAIVSAAFGGAIVWGTGPEQSAAASGDQILWGT